MSYEEILKFCREAHGDLYEYPIFEGDKKWGDKIYVICPVHGLFSQNIYNHTKKGCKCPKCVGRYNMSNEEFKKRLRELYGDKLILDKTNFVNVSTNVIVTCPEHGDFEVRVDYLLKGGGCPVCSFINGVNKTNKTFWLLEDKKIKALAVIERAKKLYGEDSDYDFSNITEVENSRTRLDIMNKKLGVVNMDVHRLLTNSNFDESGIKKKQRTKHWSFEDFETKLKELNGDKLIVKKEDFKNLQTKMPVRCVEHGEFFIKPETLLSGTKCPICEFMYDFKKSNQSFWSLIPPETKAKYVVEKFKEIHGDKYLYDRIKAVNSAKEYVEIGCKVHGYFKQTVECHLQGQGCYECNRNKIPNEVVFADIKKLYGDRYKMKEGFEYRTVTQKIPFICPEHGEFEVNYLSIKNGAKCPVCDFINGAPTLSGNIWRCNKYSPQEMAKFVIERLKRLYGDRFGYERITEVHSLDDRVDLICPIHGPFTKTIRHHLESRGCPECNGKHTITNEEFQTKIRDIHGDKYGTDIQYKTLQTMLHLNCPEHGPFDIMTKSFMGGHSCHVCDYINGVRGSNFKFWKWGTPETRAKAIIEKCNIVHKGKYTYEKFKEAKDSLSTMIVTCPKHGDFEQSICTHVTGAGCPICKESTLEEGTASLLDENNLIYKRQWKKKWLGKQSVDFVLESKKIAIECQGRQHFQEIDYFSDYKQTVKRDINKYNLLIEHGYKVLYLMPKENIDYSNVNSVQEIYTEDTICWNIDELLQKIREAT